MQSPSISAKFKGLGRGGFVEEAIDDNIGKSGTVRQTRLKSNALHMEPLKVNFPQRPINDLFIPPNLLSEDAKKQGLRHGLMIDIDNRNEERAGNNSKKSKG